MKLMPLVLVLCLTLLACGGDDEPADSAGTSTPAAEATQAPTEAATEAPADDADEADGDEGDVREMFADYTKALGDRDWDEACDHLAPETSDKLKANVKQLGLTDAPEDCEGLMGTLYAQIDKDPTAKKTIDDITKTAKVSEVKLDGDNATVSWSAKVNGTDTPVTQTARKIDGEWKLIDVN